MKKNAHIWILNHYAITPRYPGGTRHHDFGNALSKMGYNVSVIASNYNQTLNRYVDGDSKQSVSSTQEQNITFVWLKTLAYTNTFKRLLSWIHYFFLCQKDLPINKPDFIVGSSVHLFAAWAGYRLSKKHQCPFILEIRDIWPQTLIDFGISKWHPVVLFFKWLEKHLYTHADHIVTLMPFAYKHIESIIGPSKKITWISNGTTLPPLNRTPDKETFSVVYAGAMGQANCMDLLIPVAEELNKTHANIQFKLYGDGPLKPTLEQQAKEKKLTNISFMGTVPKSEMLPTLQNSHINLLLIKPKKVLSYGVSLNKFFDYLAAGQPIITTDMPNNDRVTPNKAGINADPNSSESLKNAILNIYNLSETDRIIMGNNARSLAEKEYNIDVLAKKFAQIFEDTSKK